jgi:hypothetical protein
LLKNSFFSNLLLARTRVRAKDALIFQVKIRSRGGPREAGRGKTAFFSNLLGAALRRDQVLYCRSAIQELSDDDIASILRQAAQVVPRKT